MSRASTSAVRRAKAFFEPSGLHDKLVGFSIVYVFQLHVPDKGVDFDGIDIIKLLQSLFDLSLVGLDINNEN